MRLCLKIHQQPYVSLLKLIKRQQQNSTATFCAQPFSLKVHFILNSTSFLVATLYHFAVKQAKDISWLQQGVFFYLTRYRSLERPLCLEAITAPPICLFHLSNVDCNVAPNTQTAQGWLSDLSPAMSETQTRREKLSWIRNRFGAGSCSFIFFKKNMVWNEKSFFQRLRMRLSPPFFF